MFLTSFPPTATLFCKVSEFNSIPNPTMTFSLSVRLHIRFGASGSSPSIVHQIGRRSWLHHSCSSKSTSFRRRSIFGEPTAILIFDLLIISRKSFGHRHKSSFTAFWSIPPSTITNWSAISTQHGTRSNLTKYKNHHGLKQSTKLPRQFDVIRIACTSRRTLKNWSRGLTSKLCLAVWNWENLSKRTRVHLTQFQKSFWQNW